MTTDAELREAVDALGGSVVTVGCGRSGRAAVERLARESAHVAADGALLVEAASGSDSGYAGDDPGVDASEGSVSDWRLRRVDGEGVALRDAITDGAAAFVAVGLHESADLAAAVVRRLSDAGAFGVALVEIPGDGLDAEDRETLRDLRGAADDVLLVEERGDRPGAGLEVALRSIHRLVDDVGVVNLDLADVRTVLTSGGSSLFLESRELDGARAAVEDAVATAPEGFGVHEAPAVLVHVVCGPKTGVAAAGNVVEAIRDRVAADAHVIWGATVDESSEGDALDAAFLVGGVVPVAGAGDPCPRCGETLSGYSLGDAATVACDACGYAGVSTRLR